MAKTMTKERTVTVWLGEQEIYKASHDTTTNLIDQKDKYKARLNSLREALPGAEVDMLVADMWEDDQGNVREQVYSVGSDTFQDY